MVELVHNSGPMMNKVVFGKEIRCLKDKTMGQYGLNNGDVPDSVLGFCNRQQVIAHLYLMFIGEFVFLSKKESEIDCYMRIILYICS